MQSESETMSCLWRALSNIALLLNECRKAQACRFSPPPFFHT